MWNNEKESKIEGHPPVYEVFKKDVLYRTFLYEDYNLTDQKGSEFSSLKRTRGKEMLSTSKSYGL
ncbi:MAG: hypothetical protein DRP29_01470 [Thermodesulfobacteriota bacterium]|nr:MAG: hypothetical protein DRP29_01470 [Thermodesulfobacteriota bacterium]